MQVNYGDAVGMCTVCHWAKKYKDGELGRADLCDQEWNGWTVTTTNKFHMRQVDELTKDNWGVIQREIAAKHGI